MVRFSVIIVTYNRLSLLKECLNNVLNQTYIPNNVTIVDNCSNDGTYDYLNNKVKTINYLKVYHENCNVGGAGGFHQGVKLALESNSNWFVFIDDDAILNLDYLEKIKESIENNPKYLALSGTVTTNGQIVTDHRRRLNKKEIQVTLDEYKKDNFEYDISSFCGVVFSRTLIEKIGLPEKDFFIWFDDTEYCMRSTKLTRILNVNSAVLNHKTNNYSVLNTNPYLYSWKAYYGFRNRIFTYLKHNMKIIALIFAFKIIVKSLLEIVKYPKKFSITFHNFKLVFASVCDGVLGKLGKNTKYLP